MSILKKIIEEYPDEEFLKAIGFDDAVIGLGSKGNLAYSISKCIEILMHKHGMEHEDAVDFFHFNVEGAFVSDKAPLWINDNF